MTNTQKPKPHKNPHSKFAANRIFTLNNPQAPRLCPELAKEIGLNESLVFLQIEYWIAISDNERDGRKWTYQSTSAMKEQAFSFWSEDTIQRAIKSLVRKNLIIEGEYNKKSYDRTKWYAINFEGVEKLESISVRSAKSIAATCGNGQPQNAVTIPETTTEITNKEKDTLLLVEDKPFSLSLQPENNGIQNTAKRSAINPSPFPPSHGDGFVRECNECHKIFYTLGPNTHICDLHETSLKPPLRRKQLEH